MHTPRGTIEQMPAAASDMFVLSSAALAEKKMVLPVPPTGSQPVSPATTARSGHSVTSGPSINLLQPTLDDLESPAHPRSPHRCERGTLLGSSLVDERRERIGVYSHRRLSSLCSNFNVFLVKCACAIGQYCSTAAIGSDTLTNPNQEACDRAFCGLAPCCSASNWRQ